jgi:hypothetical protein
MIDIVPMPEFLISIGQAKLKGMDLLLHSLLKIAVS